MDIQADSHRIGARLEILGENRTGLSALVNIAGNSQNVGVTHKDKTMARYLSDSLWERVLRQIERYYQTQLVRHGAHIRSIFAAWAKRTGLSALVNNAGNSQSVGVCVGAAGFPNARGNIAILLARLPDRHAL